MNSRQRPVTLLNCSQPLHDERGVIMLLLALVLLSLIGSAAITLNITYASILRGELQQAVDAAAHAGAAALCSESGCETKAQRLALETLNNFTIHGALGDSSDINIPAPTPSSPGPTWTVGNLEVTVERGRWWPDGMPTSLGGAGTGASYFEAMDLNGTNWQDTHPGVPWNLAANAVRVSVRRPQVGLILSPFGNWDYDIEAKAVAVADDISPVDIAPFAIPACRLLDPNRTYNKEDRSEFDILFTRSNQYCDSSPNCHKDSGFFWYPGSTVCDESHPENCETWAFVGKDTCSGELATCVGGYISCDFKPSVLVRGDDYNSYGADDRYGVVGIPGDYLGRSLKTPTQLIEDSWDPSAGGNFQSQIGKMFYVEHQGIIDPAMGDALWNFIQNNANNPRYMDRFGPPTVVLRLSNLFPSCIFPYFANHPPGSCGSKWFSYGTTTPSGGTCTWPIGNSPSWCINPSVCSMIYGGDECGTWTITIDANAFSFLTNDISLSLPLALPCGHFARPGEVKVWDTHVPVIADYRVDAEACGRVFDTPPEPSVTADGEYVIIGFARVYIYDVDIGDSPDAPTYCPWFGPAHEPWGFNYSQGCDVVRARIAPNNKLIGSSNPSAALRSPQLVN